MEKNFKILRGGITSVRGFQAAGIQANIKYKKRKDMALIFSQAPCVAAGVFTKNQIKAACIDFNQSNIKNPIHAIMINSGIANACTGEQGKKSCQESADQISKALQISQTLHITKDNILLASTGVIGKQLPMDKISKGILLLTKAKSTSMQSAKDAAQAIMTTDTAPKEVAIEVPIKGKKVRIAGIAKGSGMIHPNMATMLGFIVTDINISQKLLTKALKKDVKSTYNMISVDGDTSTNDMVLLLANKKARNEEILDSSDKDFEVFCKALHFVNTTLAKKIAQDGEGATKLCEVKIENATTTKQARILAKSVITSNLVKTALFGNDANWGRIICALGYSKAKFDAKKIDLSFISKAGKIEILKNGKALDFNEKLAKRILAQKEVQILVNLRDGSKSATAWGCDLSYDYVRINADYRS